MNQQSGEAPEVAVAPAGNVTLTADPVDVIIEKLLR